MKKDFLALSFAILFLILFSTVVLGQETKSYDYKDFNGVGVSSGMSFNITQSSDYKVQVTAEKEDLENLIVEKKGSTLKFYFDKDNYRKVGDIEINISMPELTDLAASGGCEGEIKMDAASKEFSAALSGGSILKGNLKCADVEFALSGGSQVELKGTGKNLSIAGSGGSIFKLKEFNVKDVESALSGGSNVKITMDGKLNTSQSGGSEMIYYGKAEMTDVNFSGGSFVKKGD